MELNFTEKNMKLCAYPLPVKLMIKDLKDKRSTKESLSCKEINAGDHTGKFSLKLLRAKN